VPPTFRRILQIDDHGLKVFTDKIQPVLTEREPPLPPLGGPSVEREGTFADDGEEQTLAYHVREKDFVTRRLAKPSKELNMDKNGSTEEREQRRAQNLIITCDCDGPVTESFITAYRHAFFFSAVANQEQHSAITDLIDFEVARVALNDPSTLASTDEPSVSVPTHSTLLFTLFSYVFTVADQDAAFERILYLARTLKNKKDLILDDTVPETNPKAIMPRVPRMPVGVEDPEDRNLTDIETDVSNNSTLSFNTFFPS
jgi:hypothetical protein